VRWPFLPYNIPFLEENYNVSLYGPIQKPPDIGQVGEKAVAAWLRGNGYSVNQNTALPGSTDIEAVSQKASLLVQVKTAVYPNQPGQLDWEEVRNLKSRASNIGYEAWAAYVQINSQGQLVGQISWKKLS
jgi:Holliday junction resolvase-like predicted endonuclease